MKKILLILSVFSAFSLFANNETTILRGKKAAEKIANSEVVRLKAFTNIPNYVKFKKGKEIPFTMLERWLNQFHTTEGRHGLKLIKQEVGKLGLTHYRYQQTINGIPVELSAFIAHVKDGLVISMNGEMFSDITVPGNASLSEELALGKALDFIAADLYKWEIEEEEEHLKHEQGDAMATYYPKGELVLINEGGKVEGAIKLAYKFNIYAQKPYSRREIFVDASSGEIVWEETKIHHADAVGSATTAYSGVQTMTTDNNGGTFRLRETGRGNGIETYDMNMGTNYGAAVDFTDNDNNWNNVNADLDEYATDAHWGSEMTYDYFLNEHGRNSIDGAGFVLRSYVHFDLIANGGPSQNNAFWDGQRMTYGDGQGGVTPLTAIDITGHEITHGLTSNTADLIYQDESGALNESFSDIFGNTIERVARPVQNSWEMGEDLNWVIRDMSNPNALNDPDTYFGTNWAPLGGADNGGVHSNSGVQNYWYYLLVNGGTGTNDNSDNYTVSGIGLTDAGSIAFRNLTVYLTQSSEFSDARFYAIQSAIDLFGGCSAEVGATTDAWYAVGVGPAYVPTASSDFDAIIVSSCIAPFTANFNNLSVNGLTFDWDFGDGNTSTLTNPSNTYMNYGTFTVELIADGGLPCGIDTTSKVAYIVIDSTLACATVLPTTGTATTQTACSGTIYDSGGATANYGADEDAIVTVTPVGASTVDLNFLSFDIEPGSNNNCDYDFVEIYNGPTTSSPLIGRYCNDNIPTTVSSTVNSITILFHSDNVVEHGGFEVQWSCNLATQAPAADFTNHVDTTCTGEVFFTDVSTNFPNSWTWDFGDGNGSSTQHPTHVYTTTGVYTVELTSSNVIGTDVETKTNLIYVNIPVAPAVIGDSVCANSSANLSASGSGDLLWYTLSSGGAVVNTGTNYTTPLLTVTTNYFVENVMIAPSLNVGKLDNTGTGSPANVQEHLFFDVSKTIEIVSVNVYSTSSGIRLFQLRSNTGAVLQSKGVLVNGTGLQTIDMNFVVDPGVDYELGPSPTTPSVDLFRNLTNLNYPYQINGLVSITHSSNSLNGGLDHYPYFYDWVVKEIDCASPREQVTAIVDPCTGIDDNTNNSGLKSFINSSNELELSMTNFEEGEYSLVIINALGQVIVTEQINVTSNQQTEIVEMDTKANGMYYVNIYNRKQNYTSKVVK